MARPIAFDKDSVLDLAMTAFWKNGYNATSINDLVDATGLLRGSLYAAFKSKHGLYVAAIDHYFEQLNKTSFQLLLAPKPPLECITNFFNHLVEESRIDKSFKGCLLVNSLLEIPVEDEEVNRQVSDMAGNLSNMFKKLLSQAKKENTLSENSNVDELSEYLIASVYGLRVYNKTRPNSKQLTALVDNILSVLK